MEKKVSIRDIAKLHVSQQLERKKAILLNLELDTCMRAGKSGLRFRGFLRGKIENVMRWIRRLCFRMVLLRNNSLCRIIFGEKTHM